MGFYNNLRINGANVDATEFWERVRFLSSFTELNKKLGRPANDRLFSMKKLRGTLPTAEQVEQIADALDTTSDYLLYGVKTISEDDLSINEMKVISAIRNDARLKKMIFTMIESSTNNRVKFR